MMVVVDVLMLILAVTGELKQLEGRETLFCLLVVSFCLRKTQSIRAVAVAGQYH